MAKMKAAMAAVLVMEKEGVSQAFGVSRHIVGGRCVERDDLGFHACLLKLGDALLGGIDGSHLIASRMNRKNGNAPPR